jgi:hypothetical protein
MWLAVIAAQTSAGYADSEPMRLTSPRSCVNLLPPEAIEQDAIEQQASVPSPEWVGANHRLAMREPAVIERIDGPGSSVPDHFSSQFDETQTAFLVVCAGVAAGGLWLAFGHSRSGTRQAQTAGNQVQVAGVELLKPLIANSLTIVEETLIFPALARLHGRPIVVERYRLDAAQPVGDPHFVVSPPNLPIDSDVVHWVSAPESEVKQPSYRRYETGLLERAPATVEGDY